MEQKFLLDDFFEEYSGCIHSGKEIKDAIERIYYKKDALNYEALVVIDLENRYIKSKHPLSDNKMYEVSQNEKGYIVIRGA